MGQLIDTSLFISMERHDIALDVLVRRFPNEAIALAAVSASELITGIHYANTEERRQRRHTFVEGILEHVPVLPFDLPAARLYARLIVDLKKSGQVVGAHDLQIGATALSHDFVVVTYNLRDFRRIPALMVRQIDLGV